MHVTEREGAGTVETAEAFEGGTEDFGAALIPLVGVEKLRAEGATEAGVKSWLGGLTRTGGGVDGERDTAAAAAETRGTGGE